MLRLNFKPFLNSLFEARSHEGLVILLMGLLGALAACQASEKDGSQFAPDKIGLSLSGLNYTDMPVGSIYVNGSWGGAVQPYNNGNGSAGSVALPYPWKPGTKVTVKWSDDALYVRDKHSLYTEEVEVPPYSMISSGYLWVAFFPGRKIKVYASGYYPGHLNFPDRLLTPAGTCKRDPECMDWYRSKAPPRAGHY